MTVSGSPSLRFARQLIPGGRRDRAVFTSTPDDFDEGGYRVLDPTGFELGKFANADNLSQAFRQLELSGGHGAGIDGFRPEHFSSNELFPIMRQVSRALLDGLYRPYPTREVQIPKGSGKVRRLALQRFTDRAVAKALLNCLKVFWRRRSVTWSTWQIYARLDRAIRRHSIYVLAIDDIRDCFPQAPLDEIMKWHRRYIYDDTLLRLIERIIRGHDGLNHLIGLDQGSPYSPIAMDVLLHHILDAVLEARTRNTPLLRYVDNLTFLCKDVCEAGRTLTIARELVENIGFQLKGADGEPQDLRDPEFNHTVLGLIPRWQNGRLCFSIPEPTFDHLAEGLLYDNEAVKPAENALRRCHGWLQMMGPALTSTQEREIVSRVTDIALRAGYRNIVFWDLLETSRKARGIWHRILRDAS